jgi:hypothetical protein
MVPNESTNETAHGLHICVALCTGLSGEPWMRIYMCKIRGTNQALNATAKSLGKAWQQI